MQTAWGRFWKKGADCRPSAGGFGRKWAGCRLHWVELARFWSNAGCNLAVRKPSRAFAVCIDTLSYQSGRLQSAIRAIWRKIGSLQTATERLFRNIAVASRLFSGLCRFTDSKVMFSSCWLPRRRMVVRIRRLAHRRNGIGQGRGVVRVRELTILCRWRSRSECGICTCRSYSSCNDPRLSAFMTS